MDSLAYEMKSMLVNEILQAVKKGQWRDISLVGNAGVEDKSRSEKEVQTEEIHSRDDDLSANIGDHLLPLMNDTNLEERVMLLKFQMANVQEEVTTLGVGLLDLAEDVEEQITIIQADITFIQAEQTTQDQRLFDVEEEVETVEADVVELQSRFETLETDVESLRRNDTKLSEKCTITKRVNGGS